MEIFLRKVNFFLCRSWCFHTSLVVGIYGSATGYSAPKVFEEHRAFSVKDQWSLENSRKVSVEFSDRNLNHSEMCVISLYKISLYKIALFFNNMYDFLSVSVLNILYNFKMTTYSPWRLCTRAWARGGYRVKMEFSPSLSI